MFSDDLEWPKDNRGASALQELEKSMKSNSKEFWNRACSGLKHSKKFFSRGFFFQFKHFFFYLYIFNLGHFLSKKKKQFKKHYPQYHGKVNTDNILVNLLLIVFQEFICRTETMLRGPSLK